MKVWGSNPFVGTMVAALLAAISSFSTSARAELVDAVVATVDKDVILYSDLMFEIGKELISLQERVTSQQEYDREADLLIRSALDNAIETLLLAREARKYPELNFSDAEWDDYERSVRENFETPEAFIEAIGGSITAWRERQQENRQAQMMAFATRNRFKDEIAISDAEIQAYYEENIDAFSTPEEVFVRQIFKRGRPDSDEREAAIATLESLRDELTNGAQFEDLAAEHSQAPGAEEGGVIGWQQRGDLVEVLESAAFALDEGEVSEVVETPFGVHLLKVDERREAGVATLDDVRLDIEEKLRNDRADERYETWLNDLRKRSRVRTFLR